MKNGLIVHRLLQNYPTIVASSESREKTIQEILWTYTSMDREKCIKFALYYCMKDEYKFQFN